MKDGARYILLSIAGVALVLGVTILFARMVSDRHLDDLHYAIACDQRLLEKSDKLYVIPMFNNHSIAANKSWCGAILKLNKTLGMHGVYHTYNEFLKNRTRAYVDEGVRSFVDCFGSRPRYFKPPQLVLSAGNKELLEKDFTVDTWLTQRFHKVYHCDDQGVFPNFIADII